MSHLTSSQIEHFNHEGYVVIKGLFSPARDLEPIRQEYAGVLERLADQLFRQGLVSSRYEELDFSERLIRLSQECGRVLHQHFDFTLPTRNIKSDTPIWTGPAVFNVLRHPGLLDAVESLIGPEIYSNPIQHVRLKLPEARAVRDESGRILDGKTAWHQDNGVVLPEADETEMLTIWFPLWDAPIESGCLQVIPRSKHRGLREHCPATIGGSSIPEPSLELNEAVPVPLEEGDALFMHRLTCHASLPNQSEKIRWSFDLRYNPIGAPTGRDAFPGFVARSRAHPETELHDAETWSHQWHEARRRLALSPPPSSANRWDGKSELCA